MPNLQPSFRYRLQANLAMLWASVMLAPFAFAQAALDNTPSVTAGAEISADAVQTRLKQLDETTGLDAAVKAKAAELYKQSLEQLRAADEHVAKAASWARLRETAPQREEQQRQNLEQTTADPQPVLAAGATLDQHRRKLADAHEELAAAQKALATLAAEPARRAERRGELPQRLQELRQELADTESGSTAKPPVGEPAAISAANQTLMLARKLALQNQIQELQEEIPAYDATAELLTLETRLGERRAAQAERAVAAWRKIVSSRRGQEAETQWDTARIFEMRLAEQPAPPAIQELAAETVELARQRISRPEDTETVGRKISGTVRAMESVTARLEKVRESRRSVEEKLKIPGIESVIAPLLLQQKRDLPDLAREQRSIADRQAELSRVRLLQISLQEQATELRDLNTLVTRLIDRVEPAPAANDRDQLARDTWQLLELKRQVLDLLRGDYATYFNKLVDLGAEEQQLITEARDYAELIDKHILWIRSITPWEPAQLQSVRRAVGYLTSWDNWAGVGQSLGKTILDRPLSAALACFAFVLLGGRQRQIRARLRALGELAAQSYLEPISTTFQALLLTLLLSVVWPAMMWFLGWYLSTALESSDFTRAIGVGLLTTSRVFWTLQLLRAVCRPQGLAESHFRWHVPRVRLLRRYSRWLSVIGLPIVFLVTVLEEQRTDEFKTTLGRLAIMLGLLIAGPLVARVVRAPADTEGATSHPVPVVPRSRLQLATYLVALLAPLLLALLAAAGFYYTALQLSWRLLKTVWLVLTLILIHDTGIRWLYLARGRLALQRLESQRAGAEEASTTTAPEAKHGPHALDLADVNLQTRRLLRVVLGFALAVGAWTSWADVLPALKPLDLPVWSTTVEVTRIVTGANHVPQHERFPETRIITVGDVVLALLVVILAFVAASNVPGLLEVVVVRHLPLDPGGRYAVITLARYALNVVGLLVGFQMIGIGWAQVQWLVAAMTFGLAFGMQEVFANFVSGVILLFERPIRVGDVVTVENITGTVTRIRIRATTIRSLDCQEFIVPNKELITGKLLNWTLSDPVNRIVVQVGIAYGSDTERARQILLRIAKDHPEVLQDPPPQVTFEQFGDSALNFVLRAYLATMDRRLDTIHDIHTAIHQQFVQAGIQIPFPQRELHIRSATGIPGGQATP
ncbi:MAG: mechanosensitive ion channel [Planctomycetota bacterium]|nr:mechanosensitive ion channel [Planctomycetota bacterium]